MSQLEMESLLRYEHNLAACYEAEYLLELSMQREHISDSAAATSWTGYEDASETRSLTFQQEFCFLPAIATPLSSSSLTRGLNTAAEGMDTESSSRCPSGLEPTALTSSSSAHSPDGVHTFTGASFTPANPSFNFSLATPHQRNGFHPLQCSTSTCADGPSPQLPAHCNGGLADSHRAGVPPSAVAVFQIHDGVGSWRSGWNGSHVEGPERKRICLHRPEL